MTNKRCLIYETLGKVSDLHIMEGASDGLMRLEGVFGVCGVKNQNNRVYDKENYKQMVESLQKTIKESGCPGELEHPNSMNINLENVSHKIESIQMNEDGTITGTIVLLNTPKGQIAQAIVEGGLPLFISSRGAGTITNEGKVTLSTIKTYDLVGTPGFSQAKLTLKANQTLECLNESVDDGNVMYAIVEGDDLLGDTGDKDDDKDKKDDKKEDSKEEKSDKKSEEKSEEKKEEKEDKKEDKEKEENKDNNKNTEDKDINMNDLKEAIDKLTDQVASLEAQMHVAQESLAETQSSISPVNYDAIQQWVSEEFAENFKNELTETVDNIVESKLNNSIELIASGVQNWITEEFAPEVQNWVCEEFAPEVQNWITEEFAPEVQNWITEEFAPEVQNWITEEFAPEVQNWITEEYSPEVQNWITEEFAPEVQNWITEEFAPVVDGWINEEFAPEHMQMVENKVNENVSAFMESQNAGRLDEIDSLLESISSDNKELNQVIKENVQESKYKGVYVVEHMPAQYKPSWEMIDESRQKEIIRSSKMYDFTKEGVLESFWSTVDFEEKSKEQKLMENNNNTINNFHNNIAAQMKYLRNNIK